MGVKQGCRLSPLLFGLYLDGLQKFLEDKNLTHAPCFNGKHVPVLLYADDIALLSHSREGLQELLNRLEIFCHNRALTVSIDKTTVIVFGKRNLVLP
jgi:hypothetical protein